MPNRQLPFKVRTLKTMGGLRVIVAITIKGEKKELSEIKCSEAGQNFLYKKETFLNCQQHLGNLLHCNSPITFDLTSWLLYYPAFLYLINI